MLKRTNIDKNKSCCSSCLFSFFFILTFLLGISIKVKAQTSSDFQTWYDAEVNYTYKQRYLFQNELSYQTLVSGGPRWYSYNTTPAFEYNLNPYFDLISTVPLSYTHQSKGFNTFEVRGVLGTRVYFAPTRRAQPRLLARYEQRWSHDENADSWDVGSRIRLRAELVYPLNKSTYFQDKMWYSITDAEIFINTSDGISERYANKTRFRAGIGYRLSYKMRFEAIYMLQLSRNTIDDKFDTEDNILRLRFKYYIR